MTTATHEFEPGHPIRGLCRICNEVADVHYVKAATHEFLPGIIIPELCQICGSVASKDVHKAAVITHKFEAKHKDASSCGAVIWNPEFPKDRFICRQLATHSIHFQATIRECICSDCGVENCNPNCVACTASGDDLEKAASKWLEAVQDVRAIRSLINERVASRQRIAELEEYLGEVLVLLLQNDFDAAREIALTTEIQCPNGKPRAVLNRALFATEPKGQTK